MLYPKKSQRKSYDPTANGQLRNDYRRRLNGSKIPETYRRQQEKLRKELIREIKEGRLVKA